MGGIGDEADGVTNLVHLPIASLTALEQRVEGPGSGPHDIGTSLIVLRIFGGDATAVDERAHKALVDIVGGAVGLTGKVLLHQMTHDVEKARNHLILRNRHSEARIKNGEPGHQRGAEHLASLEAFLTIGDDAAAIHLAAGTYHRQYGAHGDGLAAGVFLPHPILFPSILFAVGAGTHGLSIVDGGAAAHSQDKVDLMVAHQTTTLHHLLVGGVGHHTRVLDHRLAGLLQRGHDCVVDAVLLNRASAIGEHDGGAVILQFFNKMAHGILAEIKLGRIVEFEIALHNTQFFVVFEMQRYAFFLSHAKKKQVNRE